MEARRAMNKGNIPLQEGIVYVMGDEEVREKVQSMRVENKINSDHYPVIV